MVIAGGGDSALDWSIFLTDVASEVTLIHRRNEFRGALDSVEKVQELKNEGIARELVNRIQNLRKDSGFEVTDKIKVHLQHNDILAKAIQENENYIKSETLTETLVLDKEVSNGVEIEFDEIKTRILISHID